MDNNAGSRLIVIGDQVFIQNYRRGEKWLPGIVSFIYLVRQSHGKLRKCHHL